MRSYPGPDVWAPTYLVTEKLRFLQFLLVSQASAGPEPCLLECLKCLRHCWMKDQATHADLSWLQGKG
jgi:hypothetical protein